MKRLDAIAIVTTPASAVIYAMSDVDLGQYGPLAFETPPVWKHSSPMPGSDASAPDEDWLS